MFFFLFYIYLAKEDIWNVTKLKVASYTFSIKIREMVLKINRRQLLN